MPVPMKVISFLVCLVVGVDASFNVRRLNGKKLPRDAFPEPVFEKNAPSCIAEKEPCGFYSFGNTGNMPFKWVKSWCKCSEEHECVFDRTDMRMRVFRQVCVSKQKARQAELADGAEAAQAEARRKHRHAHQKRQLLL